MTDSQTVADVCPGAFADQGKLDAFGLGKTHLLRRDQQGTVEERHETGGYLVGSAHHSSPSKPAAVTRLCAMSLILRF